MVDKTVSLSRQMKVRLPTRPNFIKYLNSDVAIPIQNFSETELATIGRYWVAALIEEAREKRHRPKERV